MQHVLPTPAVSPPKTTPIPSEFELLIQRLMGNDQPVHPAPTRRSGFTEMEVLMQNLLPVVAPMQEQPADGGTGTDGATIRTETGSVCRGGCCASVLVCHYWGGVLGCFY